MTCRFNPLTSEKFRYCIQNFSEPFPPLNKKQYRTLAANKKVIEKLNGNSKISTFISGKINGNSS